MLLCTLSVLFPMCSSVISYGFYAMSYGLFAISYVSIVSPMGSPQISSKAFYSIFFWAHQKYHMLSMVVPMAFIITI